MKMHKECLLLSGCLLLASICGCQKQSAETSEYRFPSYYTRFLGQPAYQDLFTYTKEHELQVDAAYGEEASIEDDRLFLIANDKQRDALVKQNEQVLQEAVTALQAYGENVTVTYPTDYAQVTIALDPDFFQDNDIFSERAFSQGADLFAVTNIALANRILTTKDSDIGIAVTLVNAASGHTLSNAYYPYQAVTFSQEDWETSQQQDVVTPSARKSYSTLSATVDAIDEQRIIFSLAQARTLYPQDATVELCLDSVYADDVYIPYQLQKEDALVLEVDGRYALHEDGDAIPDIAPISIIPKRYVDD